MEQDSSVSDIPLPGEESQCKNHETSENIREPVQSEKIEKEKLDIDQDTQDVQKSVQVIGNLELSDQCNKSEILVENTKLVCTESDKHERISDISSHVSQALSESKLKSECSNRTVQSMEGTVIEPTKLNVHPDVDITHALEATSIKQVNVTEQDVINMGEQTNSDKQTKDDIVLNEENDDTDNDFSLHISLDSSDAAANDQEENRGKESVEVLEVVQNVANINEISEGMECEVVMEHIEELQANQIVHESIVTSEVSETVAQSAVQVGVAETVVAQPIDMNNFHSDSEDAEDEEETTFPHVNGVLENAAETSLENTTLTSPVREQQVQQLPELTVPEVTVTKDSEPESSLDDKDEEEVVAQEQPSKDIQVLQKIQSTKEMVDYVVESSAPEMKTCQVDSNLTEKISEVRVKDEEVNVVSADVSVEIESSILLENSEIKSEIANDKFKCETTTETSAAMDVDSEPVISFTPSESDTNDKTEMDTYSTGDEIVEAFVIEEVSDTTAESSSSSPQPVPIIVEPATENVTSQSDEYNQITEVLVLETVSEEATMEIDGTLTASVAENVMIEIIDDGTKTIYKSKDTSVSIDLTEHNVENVVQNNPEISQEITLACKEKESVTKKEIKLINKETDDSSVNINADDRINKKTASNVQKSAADVAESKTVYIIEDITEETPVNSGTIQKNENKIPKIPEKKSRVTRSSHMRNVSDVPCHVLGRNIDNPTEDLISNGRTPPKPRLGVKVPYRFLTSQIVSKQDLADELLELVAKRNPDPDPPAGGDIFFAKKLTQRLANKIAMSESKRLKQAASAKTTLTSEKGSSSSALTSGIPAEALSTPPVSSSASSSTTSKIVDNSDLLAILEGDVDVDWTKEIRKNDASSSKINESEIKNSPPILTPENIITVNTAATNTPPKLESPITFFAPSGKKNLDPELERQLALKQLQELPKEGGRRGRRPVNYVPPPQRKIQEIPKVRKQIVPVLQPAKEQSAAVPVKSKANENVKPAVDDYKKIVEKQLDKAVKKSKDSTPGKKTVDLCLQLKNESTTTRSEGEINEGDLIEPMLTARKGMKTYSRKETILKVPAELEYIVHDTEISALTETGESEPLQESMPGSSKIKSELIENKSNNTKKTDESLTYVKETAEEDIALNKEKIVVNQDYLKTNQVKLATNKDVNTTKNEKKEISKKEEVAQPAGAPMKKNVNKSPKKSPQIKKAKRTIAEINKPEVTLVSKRARIIKKKVIWDPAEVPKARTSVGAKKSQAVSSKSTVAKPEKIVKSSIASENIIEIKDEKEPEEIEPIAGKSEKLVVEKSGENLSNGQSEIKTLLPVTKGKLLSRVTLSKKAKKLLMQRKLRPMKSKLIRSSRGELKKSLALSKKKKQALVEIAKKVNKPKKTELDRLLMDEGAVNMLYSVKRDQKLTGDASKRKKSVISLDRAQKDLINRTKVVKDVITQSSNQEDTPKTLRKKDSPTLTLSTIQTPPRKKSRDSIRSSIQSPPPSPSYIFPPRPEASRIIRRHSSSFSSECSSPRRLSIDNQQQIQQPQQTTDKPEIKPEEQELENSKEPIVQKESTELQSPVRLLRRKDFPIYERKSDEKTYKGKKKLLTEMDTKEADEKKEQSEKGSQKIDTPGIKEKLSLAEKRKLNTEMSKNFSKQQLPKKRTRLSKMVEDEVTKDNDDKSANKPAAKTPTKTTKKIEILKNDIEEKQRMTTRQISLSTGYKEIGLRKIDSLVQIILTPTFTKLKNPITLQMFHELSDVLAQLSKDNSCRVVLITSTDSSFCHGVDFSTLVQPSAEKRLAAAQEMAKALKEFLRSLATFPKPLVAGVQGSAVGLGVTMLPLFDLVLASDKATFSTPYGRLGHVPEGIAFLTLPNLLGTALTSELLFANRKLTASEALHHGLVTRILWPDKFQEELIASSLVIANQSTQCVMATKALLRQSLLLKLDESLESEHKLLIEHWISNECQQNFKKLLQEDEWW